jgi:hypothetical protein
VVIVALLWRARPTEFNMSSKDASTETSTEVPEVGTIDMKLEVVTLPVSHVDREERLYQSLGWRLDADFTAGDDVPGCSSRRPTRSARSTSARASRQVSRGPLTG